MLTSATQYLQWRGLPVSQMATPAVVFSRERLRDNAATLQNCFRDAGLAVGLHFPVKACPLSRVVEELVSVGFGVEVQSLFERRLVGAQGVPCIFNGPRKTRKNLAEAFEEGIVVIADSLSEVEDIWSLRETRYKSRGAYGIRIQPATSSGFFQAGNKLGMDEPEWVRAIEGAMELGDPPGWVQFHNLARCTRAEEWTAHVEYACRWLTQIYRSTGLRFDVVDLGGGWDVRSRLHDPLIQFSQPLVEAMRRLPYQPRVVLEMGRFVVADAAIGITRVVRTKRVTGHRWVIVDISTNLLVPLPLAEFQVHAWESSCETLFQEMSVADGACSPNAVIQRNALLPAATGPGTLLAITDCGAYTYSVASLFGDDIAPAFWWWGNDELESISFAKPGSAEPIQRAIEMHI